MILIFVMYTFVDPAVEQECDQESHHEENRSQIIVSCGSDRFGYHVKGHNAKHEACGNAQ
jgi:hypothetical protein